MSKNGRPVKLVTIIPSCDDLDKEIISEYNNCIICGNQFNILDRIKYFLTSKEQGKKGFETSSEEEKLKTYRYDILSQIACLALAESYSVDDNPEVNFFRYFRNLLLPQGLKEFPTSGISFDVLLEEMSPIRKLDYLLRDEIIVEQLVRAYCNRRYITSSEGIKVRQFNTETSITNPIIRELIKHVYSTGRIYIEESQNETISDLKLMLFLKKQVVLSSDQRKLGKNLYAFFNCEKEKDSKNEEVLISSHSMRHSFKLLAVAECDSNDNGISIILSRLNEWFLNLDPRLIKSSEIAGLLSCELSRINYEIMTSSLPRAKMSVAVVNNMETVVASFGGQKCYHSFGDTLTEIQVGVSDRLGTEEVDKRIIEVHHLLNTYDKLFLSNAGAARFLVSNSEEITSLKSSDVIKRLKKTFYGSVAIAMYDNKVE